MRSDYRYRSFDINNIFEQKLSYEWHKKKLKELSTTPVLNFNIFPDRTEQINRYRNSKHISFIKQLKERDSLINRSNIKIFDRLAGTQDITRQLPETQNYPVTARKEDNPRRRRLSEAREHQNERMQIRLKSLVSSINNRKISDEYRKSLQIRNRITRYETNPLTNRIAPKVQKFVNLNTTSGSIKSDTLRKSEHRHPRSISNLNKESILDQEEKRAKLIQSARNNLALKRKLRNAHLSILGEGETSTTVRPQTTRAEDGLRQVHKDRLEQDSDGNTMFPTQIQNQQRKTRTTGRVQ